MVLGNVSLLTTDCFRAGHRYDMLTKFLKQLLFMDNFVKGFTKT